MARWLLPRNADLTGLVFHRLTVVRRGAKTERGQQWVCRCECGAEKALPRQVLVSGVTKSCGCYGRSLDRTGPRKGRDITGRRNGRLVAIEPTERREGQSVVWRCRCDCGAEVFVNTSRLRKTGTSSCGCLAREALTARTNDLTGMRFGRLTAVRREGSIDNKPAWRCLCDCGKEITTRASLLSRGVTRSCGCLRDEERSAFARTRTGPANPNWRPDRDEVLRQRERYASKESRDWHKAILARDGRRCRRCGGKDRLNAHHLDGWRWAKERRTDVSNGVLLCRPCHTAFHSAYGIRNNTRAQFEEWMGATRGAP